MTDSSNHVENALHALSNLETNQLLIELALRHLNDPSERGYSASQLLLEIYLSKSDCDIENLGFAFRAIQKELKKK